MGCPAGGVGSRGRKGFSGTVVGGRKRAGSVEVSISAVEDFSLRNGLKVCFTGGQGGVGGC